MVIFHSYVSLPEATVCGIDQFHVEFKPLDLGLPWVTRFGIQTKLSGEHMPRCWIFRKSLTRFRGAIRRRSVETKISEAFNIVTDIYIYIHNI